ncbi:hypothetical protein SI65_08213 [Aspergillus cristatus]|uniref:DUF4470 domain-containing protein n=1 Tax=Aspergillus cristatus TaxID=573508 RepID=A0A1E3B5M3_ASPCR|nr:hypothetical protein SI65_08213 [Aspergillus cristatus]
MNPAWILESRTPSFIGSGIGEQFGAKKYLWGNVPALDVLQLESNEGEDQAGDLRILFAASGDLRNIVKTVARLPRSYSHSLEITINDRDFEIVARNIILLLIALVVEKVDEAVDCIIHLWYSALKGQRQDIWKTLRKDMDIWAALAESCSREIIMGT